MAFTLQHIVPWGRNLDEYKAFFELSDTDLKKKTLSVADGPASFNAEIHQAGFHCVSFDPVYQFKVDEINKRIQETKDEVIQQLMENQVNFIWEHVAIPEELVNLRLNAMDTFLQHFEKHQNNGRYVAGELPVLPFETDSFELVLCSHFLFLYSQHLDIDFHEKSIREMIRVGKEIRIFPLLDIDAKPSPYVDIILKKLNKENVSVEIKQVNYEFQKGGNKMMVIKR